MQRLKQPNKWSCLPVCLANLREVPLERIYQLIGHDGSELVVPDLGDPEGRRCFNIYEIMYAAHELGMVMVPYFQDVTDPRTSKKQNFPGFYEIYEAYDGILIGDVKGRDVGHAVWKKDNLLYDPSSDAVAQDAYGFDYRVLKNRAYLAWIKPLNPSSPTPQKSDEDTG